MKLFPLMIILSVIQSFVCADNEDNIISIESGKIAGEERENFVAYRGIPYAVAPVGDLRFSPPEAFSQSWDGVREFKSYSAVCAQYDHLSYAFDGSEDCLKLNVFVPNSVLKSSEKVPVIFFIHGGAFMFGASSFYLPENIMDMQNMILVTVNYRLGVLGFLSTEDEVIPGNFGMKDQVEALKWVQKNIGAFNGDPEKVTIVGYSAGGASVHLHFMSHLTDGLFNNGISHSGVSINPWVMVENSKEKARQVASFMNCSQEDHKKMLKCLREKPAEDLVLLAKKFQPFLYNPFSPFGVVVEPESPSAFLTDHPINILKNGNFKKLPWLLSQTQDEGLYPAAEFYNDDHLKTINDNWDQLAPFILDFNGTTKDENEKLRISQDVRKFYFHDRVISKETFPNLRLMITDRLYHSGAYESLKYQSIVSKTYFYYFRYITKAGNVSNDSKEPSDKNKYLGVSHGDDVFLIYQVPENIPYSEDELVVSRNLIKLYNTFSTHSVAYYGNTSIKKSHSFVQGLEILTSQNYSMQRMDDKFGNFAFWNSLNINDN